MIDIGGRMVGHRQPCFIIAEVGVNHNGDIKLAEQLIEIAADAGADAVKFQTFRTDMLITRDAPKAPYQLKTTGRHETQFQMLKHLELSDKEFRGLKAYCDSKGIMFLSTPYDEASSDLLIDISVPALKIASTDTTNLPLLRYLAAKEVPMIISTGMSTLSEVDEAVRTVQEFHDQLVLLHCTSDYPASVEDVNLLAIPAMSHAFKLPIGYSDHTAGIGVGPYAIAVGACMLEKHFTVDRDLDGPDHLASLEPDELVTYIGEVRMVETALGDGLKRPMPSELRNKRTHQKSLVAARFVSQGTIITEAMVRIKRPATGLEPRLLGLVVGRRAACDIQQDDLITVEMLSQCTPST